MRGPDHYLAGEEHLRYAEDLYRNGHAEDLDHGMLAGVIAQAHFAAAQAAAVAVMDAYQGPISGYATGRPDADKQAWQQVLVDDPDPELSSPDPASQALQALRDTVGGIAGHAQAAAEQLDVLPTVEAAQHAATFRTIARALRKAAGDGT